MRQSSSGGFTLIELLIVVAIIGILAAILIPNLLSARARAFDAGVQTCLKELAARQEIIATDFPFAYDGGFDPVDIDTCADVVFTNVTVSDNFFSYDAQHDEGISTYRVQSGTSVRRTP